MQHRAGLEISLPWAWPSPPPLCAANVPEVITVAASNVASKYNGTKAGERLPLRGRLCTHPCYTRWSQSSVPEQGWLAQSQETGDAGPLLPYEGQAGLYTY